MATLALYLALTSPCVTEAMALWGEPAPPYDGIECMATPGQYLTRLAASAIAPDSVEPWSGPGLYTVDGSDLTQEGETAPYERSTLPEWWASRKGRR